MRKRRKIIKLKLLIILLGTVIYGAVSISGNAYKQVAEAVTFNKDVAPIFYQHCVECHRPGNIAPMSLITYKDAQPFARWISEKVKTRQMPPWHADPNFGEFENARRLTQEEVNTVLNWVEQGAVEGNPKDLPPVPSFPAQWKIGQPDAVFKMAEENKLGADAVDEYVYVRIPTNFKEDKWIQSVEFRPGNLKIVHHAVAFIETPENFAEAQRINPSEKSGNSAWSLLETPPSPLEIMDGTKRRIKPDAPVVNDGCGALDVNAVSFVTNNNILSVYAPGRGIDKWSPGTAKKIPAGSNILLQMHYSKGAGKPEKDQTSVALVFAQKPVEKMVSTQSVNNDLFAIPPGAENHRVTACWNIQRDVQLISFMPHMHVRGKSMRYEAIFPDGRRQTLLNVPRYSFHWQTVYMLKQPVAVPAGSRIMVTAYFDNSDGNMHNPDSSQTIRHGTATFDEMMIGFVDYVVPKPREHIAVKINPDVYDAYVGDYALDSKTVLTIKRVGKKLYAEAAGQLIELFPLSETDFFSKKTDSELSFIKNDKGETTEFVITNNEKLVRAKRINKAVSIESVK